MRKELRQVRDAVANYLVGATVKSAIMDAWDSARQLILDQPYSSLARECFELQIDEIDVAATEALAALDGILNQSEEALVDKVAQPFAEIFSQYDYDDCSTEAGEEREEFKRAAKAALRELGWG